MPLSVRSLQPVHAEAVYSLYLRVIACTQYGHLAEKSINEFESILSDESASVSVGAWSDERLVAYALSLPQGHAVYMGSPLMRHIQSEREVLYSGGGTVVDPEFQGRQIMIRLLRERMALLRKREVPHFVGLAAVSNLPSLVSLMRVGHWLVGLEHDVYCQNFVTYHGTCAERFDTVDEVNVPYDDLQELKVRFDSGWIAAGLKKNKLRRELVLHRVPALEQV